MSKFVRQGHAEDLLCDLTNGLNQRLASIPKLKQLLKMYCDDYTYRLLHEIDMLQANRSPRDGKKSSQLLFDRLNNNITNSNDTMHCTRG